MFKLQPNPTFVCAVLLSVAGMPAAVALSITFRHRTKTALQAWISGSRDKPDAAMLHEVIVGWSGMQDADGQDVPYSLTALAELLENYPVASKEIFNSYVHELTESRIKN